MMRSMSARQFFEWKRYAVLEPFGEERADYRTGAIITVLANANRNPKKRPRPFSLEECTPKFGDSKASPSAAPAKGWQQMKQIAQMMTATANAEASRRRPRRGP